MYSRRACMDLLKHDGHHITIYYVCLFIGCLIGWLVGWMIRQSYIDISCAFVKNVNKSSYITYKCPHVRVNTDA